MGLTSESLEFILHNLPKDAKTLDVLTLGRQRLYVSRRAQDRILARSGLSHVKCDSEGSAFAESFFRRLECVSTLDSLDASPYEGAAIIHDLNVPLEGDLVGAYDVVIDAGTTEHVYELPTAWANVQRLVKPGGVVMHILPSNNFCGHGFYQISPEALFRAYAKGAGFDVLDYQMSRSFRAFDRRMWRVTDPAKSGLRVSVYSRQPLTSYFAARRCLCDAVDLIGDRPATYTPLQSDYEMKWNQSDESSTVRKVGAALYAQLLRRTPRVAYVVVGRVDMLRSRFYNRRSFQRA